MGLFKVRMTIPRLRKILNPNSLTDSGQEKGLTSIFQLLGPIIAAVGGIAGLIIGFGYITLHSFLSSLNLYGLASFSLQFYKEASINFFRDFLRFYSVILLSKYFFILLIPILMLVTPFIVRNKIKSNKLLAALNFAGFVFTIFVIIVTIFKLDILPPTMLKPLLYLFVGESPGLVSAKILFFIISLPVLLSLLYFLILNSDKFDFKSPFSRMYGPLLFVFILLFLSIPQGYGYFIYDMRVFLVLPPNCSEDTSFGSASGVQSTNQYQLLYLMGHTSDREVFFNATTIPTSLVLVRKEVISSINVNINAPESFLIRKLFEKKPIDIFEQKAKDDLEKLLPKEPKRTAQNETDLNDWIDQKVKK